MRCYILLLLITCYLQMNAQVIIFDPNPELAENRYAVTTPRQFGHCADSLRVDTIYTENLSTGNMDLIIQTYPLSRYEFYSDGTLYRRIDIEQKTVQDTASIENVVTGEIESILQEGVEDIPNGAYHEFFPNGNIRIKGTLAGYNDDGTLRKTGEWIEWDEDERMISKETYP